MACGLLTSSSCCFLNFNFKPSSPPLSRSYGHGRTGVVYPRNVSSSIESRRAFKVGRSVVKAMMGDEEKGEMGIDSSSNTAALQAVLWGLDAAYIVWLFLLPYAPGDPVWAISSTTVNDLIGLSLNFFFILPISNAVGVHIMEAPVLHPASEGLFNFVIGWTLLFAPLLFTDCKRGRFKWSLELLWGMQMFLTNVFLIPYMAIRLNKFDADDSTINQSSFISVMTRGAKTVAVTGGAVCLLSTFWCIIGRADGGYGGLVDRWEYLRTYTGSERLAYAFLWDIALYSIFQPWLIGDNLQNLKEGSVGIISKLRFIPVIGLVAYLLNLENREER